MIRKFTAILLASALTIPAAYAAPSNDNHRNNSQQEIRVTHVTKTTHVKQVKQGGNVRHVQQHHRYHKGETIRDIRSFLVVDYRQRNLPPPARGQHYVEKDGQVLLAAIATGVIVGVILGAQ